MKSHYQANLMERDSNDIDLIELALQLWRGKWLILIFIILGLAIGGALIIFSPQKWSSTAIITQPDSAQIASYSHAMNVLNTSNTTNSTTGHAGSAVNSSKDLDTSEIETRVFSRLSVALSALAEAPSNQGQRASLTIVPMVKDQTYPLKLSVQAGSAEAAQTQLIHDIEQTGEKISQDLGLNLHDSLQQHISMLNSLLVNQEKIAQEQKDLRIQQIKEALIFAQAANITHPQYARSGSLTQDTLFLLGSEALTAMVERESMRPLAYPESYFQTRQQLLETKSLTTDKANISVYRYVLKPTLPIKSDSRKRALILMLGALLGAFAGCGLILIRNTLRKYKTRH